MDILYTCMDIHRYPNEFMHLSPSKVSQWPSKHASQLWSHHYGCQLAWKDPKQCFEISTLMHTQKKLITSSGRCSLEMYVHAVAYNSVIRVLAQEWKLSILRFNLHVQISEFKHQDFLLIIISMKTNMVNIPKGHFSTNRRNCSPSELMFEDKIFCSFFHRVTAPPPPPISLKATR